MTDTKREYPAFPTTFRGCHPLFAPGDPSEAEGALSTDIDEKITPDQDDDTIEVGGKRITAAEAERRLAQWEEQDRKVKELSDFRDSALALTQETDPGRLYDHAVKFLRGKGLDARQAASEARDYVQRMTGTPTQDDIDDSGGAGESVGRKSRYEERLEETVTEQKRLDGEIRRLKAAKIEAEIDLTAASTLDSDEELRKMMDGLKGLGGDTGLKVLRDEVKKQAVENLRHRRNVAGSWSDSWVQEETGKAARQVLARYRSVIGDPSKLGRSAETEGGGSDILALRSKAPVAPPKNTRREPEDKLDAYVDDHLLRGLGDRKDESLA